MVSMFGPYGNILKQISIPRKVEKEIIMVVCFFLLIIDAADQEATSVLTLPNPLLQHIMFSYVEFPEQILFFQSCRTLHQYYYTELFPTLFQESVPDAHKERVHFKHIYFNYFLTHRSPPYVYTTMYRNLRARHPETPSLGGGQTLILSVQQAPDDAITIHRDRMDGPVTDAMIRSLDSYVSSSRVNSTPVITGAYDLEKGVLFHRQSNGAVEKMYLRFPLLMVFQTKENDQLSDFTLRLSMLMIFAVQYTALSLRVVCHGPSNITVLFDFDRLNYPVELASVKITLYDAFVKYCMVENYAFSLQHGATLTSHVLTKLVFIEREVRPISDYWE